MTELTTDQALYDVIIVGGASAGLTAALYASRRALKTLVLTKDIGGQLSLTNDVENYPGFEQVGGFELADKMKKQAEKFGAVIKFETVTAVDKQGEQFLVTSYCATCDMPLFRQKRVVVVGGGNSAIDAALYATDIASEVHLIHRRNEFRGEAVLVERLKSKPNLTIHYNSTITQIHGQERVSGVTLQNIEDQSLTELSVEGVFIEIGYVVKSEFVAHLVQMTERHEIVTNRHYSTSCPGIFAAGDLTTTPFKQAVISAGEGCVAALAAYEYIMKQTGRQAINVDWGGARG
ncbi:MAG: glucose-inhibited division protein A [Candidatus Berkelbacteria bacterium Gr01-1014_85]|uniref:Glucose-inhibited division protein A n=1 Tax=Candidatus Berkelbacteria bacterium Gr01-1014_85 TaxID=2017150 RepID=A0A554JCR6_9BACT|nr:MAG: glucose-inhibited division protein A [Candidatus Berkelbacteria bacterium Gr01-1014_85]